MCSVYINTVTLKCNIKNCSKSQHSSRDLVGICRDLVAIWSGSGQDLSGFGRDFVGIWSGSGRDLSGSGRF